jgi:Fur family ferric uptake transcriptional regulator
MPVPHRAQAVAAPTLHAAIGALRARGLRLSAPRRRLLECLYTPDAPRTAEQLAAAGAGAVATVYRNLTALEEAGLVRHSHSAGGAATWAPASAVRATAECERCGRRVTLDRALVAQVRAVTRRALGFEVHLDHLPLPGLCADCAAVRAEGRRTNDPWAAGPLAA